MKALSMTQPYGQLVVLRAKRLETRSWGTGYRGPLAIQAAKGFPRWAKDLCREEPFRSALGDFGLITPLPVGSIIGMVDLMGCVPTDIFPTVHQLMEEYGQAEGAFGDFGEHRFAWKLENPRMLAVPVPCKGTLSIWTVPEDVAALVARGLEETTHD